MVGGVQPGPRDPQKQTGRGLPLSDFLQYTVGGHSSSTGNLNNLLNAPSPSLLGSELSSRDYKGMDHFAGEVANSLA